VQGGGRRRGGNGVVERRPAWALRSGLGDSRGTGRSGGASGVMEGDACMQGRSPGVDMVRGVRGVGADEVENGQPRSSSRGASQRFPAQG
jgi:hypothetical protein